MSTRSLDPSNPYSDYYKTTRELYHYEALFEYLCAILSTSAFMAKLTITLGIHDSITALIGTLSGFVGLIQLVSGRLARLTPIKPWLVPISLFTRLCLMGMFLLPFLKIGGAVDVVLLLLVLLSQITSAVVSPVKQSMYLTTVSEEIRMRYMAKHNAVSLLFGMPVVLLGGLMLDKLEAKGRMSLGFLIVALLLLFFAVCHVLVIVFSKEPPIKKSESKNAFAEFGLLFKNKKFCIFLLVETLHSVANGTLSPYLGTYAQRVLGLSLGTANLFTTIQMAMQFGLMILIGRIGKKMKSAHMHAISFGAYVLYDIIWLLMSPENAVALHIPVIIFGAVAGSAYVAYIPVLCSTTREEERASAIALAATVRGIVTFLVTLALTPFFNAWQTNGVTLFGVPLYAQQMLAVLSIVIRFVVIGYWLFHLKYFKSDSYSES